MISYNDFLLYEDNTEDKDIFMRKKRGYTGWHHTVKEEEFSGKFYCILKNAVALNIFFDNRDISDSEDKEKRVSKLRYSPDLKWIEVKICVDSWIDWERLVKEAKYLKYIAIRQYSEQIPQDIYDLQKLTYLELWRCNISKSFEKVINLRELEVLIIDESKISKLPEEIEKLDKLIKFSCMRTAISELPIGMGKLKNLQYLGLNSTKIIEVSESLFGLTELRELYLGDTSISILPNKMKNLSKLEHLALWRTEIFELPDWICDLTKLKGLYLGESEKICRLPDKIGNLLNLEKLYLYGTGIHILPDSFGKLNNLQEIWLEGIPLRRFPELDEMPNLQCVDLRNMTLERIPSKFINEKMRISFESKFMHNGLLLENTKLLCQPISLFAHEKEFIDAYYEEEKIHLNETKVVFLGDGEAGKSHIIERMKNNGRLIDKFQDGATPGIAISEKEYSIDKEVVKLQIWDFGGQEIMHSMHRFFLTDRTLYVIVINSRDNTQDERAKYWLNNVKSFAEECPIILVLNKIDQNPSASLNERLLQNDFPQIVKTIKMSALNDSDADFSKLKDTILNAVKGFDSYAMEFPITWNNIKHTLMQMEENYIIDEQYRKICIDNKVEDKSIQNWLLDWFHDLGVSFNYYKKDVLLGGYMVLKPQWITNAIYIILFNGMDKAVNGLLPVSEIVELLKNPPKAVEKIEYNISEIPYILGVMRRFEISYEIDKDYEFIPMMCIKNQHEEAAGYVENCDLEYYMEYEYLPNNVLHKLMIKMKSDLVQDKIWLTGMILQATIGGVCGLVRLHDKRIEIYIKVNQKGVFQPKEYLNEIRKHLLLINEELNLDAQDMIVYKEDGHAEAISYETLLIHLNSGQKEYFSTTYRKMIPIMEILGIVENNNTISQILKVCEGQTKVDNKIVQSVLYGMYACERLEQDIISNCIKIQGDTLLILQGKENHRNTHLRDLLEAQRYDVHDQTLNGLSLEGKEAGELDLLIKDYRKQPIAIIEAFNLSCVDAEYIKKHVNKLFSYDTWGLEKNYILVYAKTSSFTNFCKKYMKFMEEESFCQKESVNYFV